MPRKCCHTLFVVDFITCLLETYYRASRTRSQIEKVSKCKFKQPPSCCCCCCCFWLRVNTSKPYRFWCGFETFSTGNHAACYSATGHEPQTANHRLRTIGYQPQVTNHRQRTSGPGFPIESPTCQLTRTPSRPQPSSLLACLHILLITLKY